MSDPYREGKNPFANDPSFDLLGGIREGRTIFGYYVAILGGVLFFETGRNWIGHWKRTRSSKREQGSNRTAAPPDECEGLLELQSSFSAPPSKLDKIWGFLNSQPEGEDAQKWGLMIFISVYILLTIFHSMYQAMSHPILLAFRLGLMSAFNMTVLYILGLKHTPLSWLTGWSYEQINILHRWSGAITVVASASHGLLFLYYYKFAYILDHRWTIMGVVSSIAFFLIGITSLKSIRIQFYEFFYAVHLILSLICIPGVFFHYPTAKPYAFIAGIAFLYDRIYRLIIDFRVVDCGVELSSGDTVILKLQPNNNKGWLLYRPYSWKPGQHIFLTLFSCGPLESHPFTIASIDSHNNTSMDLIIRARNGFSRRLYQRLLSSPPNPSSLTALIHGPYGTLNIPANLNNQTIILISGGAGVAFTYPIYQYCLQQQKHVEFLWIIPHREFCDWIDYPFKESQIWITRERGRPDVPGLLREYIMNDSNDVWIGTCGPDALIRSLRNTVADMKCHQHIELHVEEFGW